MEPQIRSAEELVHRAVVQPGLLDKIKADPSTELQNLAAQVVKDFPAARPIDTDIWIYRLVVGSLGFVVLAAVIGAIVLAVGKVAIPETLTALGSAAVGALAGLLAPSPAGQRNP